MRETKTDRIERVTRYVLIWMAWFFICFAVLINLTH